MLALSPQVVRVARRTVPKISLLAFFLMLSPGLNAQEFFRDREVGGIFINPSGLLENSTMDEMHKLSRFRAQALQQIPEELNEPTPLRKVSLSQLEKEIEKCLVDNQELPDQFKYLAGLQQIHYVLVYPEQRDIVLVGPAEGWKIDQRGNVVGTTTGRAVMLLDDLLVALRTARQAANGGISCSIDPTAEGLARLRNLKPRRGENPRQWAATIEEVLGPQKVSFTGLSPTSHFARVLVAADYRMKRLGMGFEESPILPSYLSMMKASSRNGNLLGPRWWLEPDYEPLLRSPDGLAWELRGASVKAMTEQDFLTTAGNVKHGGKASPSAEKWAALMTEKYPELAVTEPVFGQLRNCMELAIIGALVVKERLTEKAGYSMPILLDPADVKTKEYTAPRQIASKASLLKKDRNWVISASGGISLNSWSVADKVRQSNEPAKVHAQTIVGKNDNWWWN